MKVIYLFSLVGLMLAGCTSSNSNTNTNCSSNTTQTACNTATYAGTGCVWGGSACYSSFTACENITDTTLCGKYTVQTAVSGCYVNAGICTAATTCTQINNQGNCMEAVFKGVGCSWSATTSTCASIANDCTLAQSQAACSNGTTNTCVWKNNVCSNPAVAACSASTTSATCAANYQTGKQPCVWSGASCTAGACSNATSKNICSGSGCTWTSTKLTCTPIIHPNCRNFGTFLAPKCCPAGATSCPETDLNFCSFTLGCTDKASAICSPNPSDTACCAGSSTSCITNDAGCNSGSSVGTCG